MKVNNLTTIYKADEGIVKAVDDVSFELAKGEVLGILGESGSGKSTIAHSIMRLIYPPGEIVSGEIIFDNKELLKLSEAEMVKIRGAKISMIFQDPFTSLNPVYTIGDQIAEAISLHQGLNRKDAFSKAVQMLETVHIKDPEKRAHDYPHQFSGGMRQRAMIAMALACRPEILIADEPTTALDVTIQAEILKLIKEIQEKFKLSVLYITHNFGIIKAICQKVMVLYKGKVVESGDVGVVLSAQRDPYTKRLIECLEVLKK
ncbi:MAG: ABC transporter ATP-binding protein [Candidatus Margulisiibacteriota bacterium]|nr:ABC transporter ATP-binding protein [Candidatus Margulisiibacteriota bacterium]